MKKLAVQRNSTIKKLAVYKHIQYNVELRNDEKASCSAQLND